MKEYSKEDIERYAKAAEDHMRRIGDLSVMARRPFESIFNSARSLYRLGILFELAQIGLHTVLDFGAGLCWLSLLLNRMGVRTISLDVSETALKVGHGLFESDPDHRMDLKPLFLSYDGETFPLENECVDRVLSFDAFHHIPNPRRILGEIYRVLRPGGIFAMTEPGLEHSSGDESKREMEMFGTLERDIDAMKVAELAAKEGFSYENIRISLDSLPQAAIVYMPEYIKFMRGITKGADALAHAYLTRHTTMAFHKGRQIQDSRRPGRLSAKIKPAIAPKTASPGQVVEYLFNVENTGDTNWLARSETGGHVTMGTHLRDAQNNMVAYEFYRAPLSRDVAPGESIEVKCSIVAPGHGSWNIEFDMVDEQVIWFADARTGSTGCAIPLDVL